MGNNYLLSLTPTFTQGLVLGQLSILFLLALILKYLFLEAETATHSREGIRQTVKVEKERYSERGTAVSLEDVDYEDESTAWFNLLLHKVVETYRSKLRDDLPGAEGDEIARRRIERFINKVRPKNFLDEINIISVNLGSSAPRISNAKVDEMGFLNTTNSKSALPSHASFDMTYTDTLSVSLSTCALFHYPLPYFVRLPVRLNISLSLFSAKVVLTPPDPLSANPTFTISLPPTFTLDLETKSLIGSRAKLEDVPKLHELIEAQVRRVLAERGTWKVVLPWVANIDEVKEEAAKEEGSEMVDEEW